MSNEFEPKIMGFLCNWCSYAGADTAGIARFQYPPNLRIMRTMCTGRVDPIYILKALQKRYDGVLVFGCHPGDCHYLEGNICAAQRIELVRYLLEISGIDQDRLHLRWVSATEGQQFAEYVTELTDLIRKLGPLDHNLMAIRLAAVSRAVMNADLRWLIGLQRQLTEQENVYHERLDPTAYDELLRSSAQEEYHRGLLYEALQAGPQTVRQIAALTGLPIFTLSLRLNDLEKISLVSIQGHEGHSPKFGLVRA
jgi:F420-non-reducing hydrogenase iron-sulfur subunit